eukprot:1300949-Pyramimonas_sp.AAC.1
MNPTGEVDIHSDSGFRRLRGDADDDVEGDRIRGATLLRRETRYSARSSYSAETLAAAHKLEDCYPTIDSARAPRVAAHTHTHTQLKNILELGGLSTEFDHRC